MKDIDKLQKRNRKLRDLTERAGSTGLAITGLIGLLFLGVLVWQIAEPTFIKGEQGEITPASEWIPESDYRFKWDFPTVDENGEPFTDPVVLRFEWDDENGSHSHDVEINVIDTRQVKTDIYIDSTGVDQTEIDVGRKTNFNAYSSLSVPVSVEQISGPVPNADETGYPAVNTFVITGDVHVLWDDENEQVFQPMELLAWITLLILVVVLTWPNVAALNIIQKLQGRRTLIKLASYILAGTTFVISDGMFVAAALASICWIVSGIILYKIAEGIERLESLGRELSETSRLKHSISARDGVLMWSRMLLFTSTLFIPLLIDIPFLTERYQDIFIPYASGIRAAFYGTIWVMLIAMLVSIPVSVGAAIYLEEYAKPNRTTKLIQALVTNLSRRPLNCVRYVWTCDFRQARRFWLGLRPLCSRSWIDNGCDGNADHRIGRPGSIAQRSSYFERICLWHRMHEMAGHQRPRAPICNAWDYDGNNPSDEPNHGGGSSTGCHWCNCHDFV